MIELPLVLLGGLLGSSHCIGMCGGFALTIGVGAPHWGAMLSRQLLYSAGRLFTYAALGGMLGFAGSRLMSEFAPLVRIQAWLSIAAGSLLIVQGMLATGLVRWPSKSTALAICPMSDVLRAFLHSPRGANFFLAGVATGFLPCGLVYTYLALAMATGALAHGMLIMAAFGLGTVPLMVATGLGGGLVTLKRRQLLLRCAAWCVLATGVITLARGVSFATTAEPSAADCPFCESHEK